MSSTTDRTGERGQVLVLFAGAIAVLLVIAALAFDVGLMLFERRDQQNAADAAALAGARYVLASGTGTSTCPATLGTAPASTSPAAARWAACNVAMTNGTGDDETITIHVPPIHGEFRGLPGFLEVQVTSSRDSVFGGIVGRAEWPVGVTAVAANQPGISYSFGMLALDPEACKAIHISGTGTVESAANVQSNSTGEGCGDGSNIGLSRSGGGVLNVTAPDAVCRSGGEIQDQGVGTMTCTQAEFSFALPDPLKNLPAPAKPPLAAAMKEVTVVGGVETVISPTNANIPDHCPGKATPANRVPSETTPTTCVLGQGGPSQTGRKWILSPGLYPAGLDFRGQVTVYLLPGVYWIGGGGIRFASDVKIISIESETDRAKAVCTVGATPPCTGGGGVLIYNTKLPNSAAGTISLGGSGATLSLQPHDYPFGDTTVPLVIFQDRDVSLTVTLNGSSAQAAEVRGIVYVPGGQVKVNGSNSVFTMDQVIADTFLVNGSGGTIKVLRENGVDAEISAVGLVE